VAGLELAAHYSPSGRTDVGGDFYDVIPLPDNTVGLFVGDVMGRGVAAAAAMAEMRAAVRAYIALDPTPTSVLSNLDRMHALLADEQLVTLIYLVVDLEANQVVIGNAGHPPAFLVGPRGSPRPLADHHGVPLGVDAGPREQATVPFGNGDTLLLFTDGLVERRTEDIDVGLGRLVASAGGLGTADLAAGLDALVIDLRDPSRDDDVAALAVRRRGS
jgi:serine phosphatase RsbU (regulator of sigma subunit)